ncbi:hypothetical protein K7E08_05575 [Ligilactobacillus salivarius]|uniref:hypothetical protein n=1 Tax=Ligilactobacillus salivarius TaxID=1624 RepID=UPI001CBBC228|nr:hypothetical protein [Ligilactobacillus salivarius]MBZ4025913.1 hypothetical protein [Ligilactobacillus salivarius]MBZ4030412.1 hypothetical protein [Ligilactobacillus salivarius]
MGSGYRGYLNTKGAEDRFKPEELMDELRNSGVKYTEKDVILVVKNYSGKLLWLEKGNEKSGLEHILKEHSKNFKDINIPELIKILVKQKPLKHYSKDNGRKQSDVYIYEKNGKKYLLAYGSNGYIVTFFRISGGKYVHS